MPTQVLTKVQAQRGATLRCKGWRQESLLRMLENNLENGERPEDLVVYGGIGKAARNWESYHAIVATLKELADDETLAVQAGMPVAVFKTHRLAPRVVMGNTNVIKADWPMFYELVDRNLTTFSSYTRGLGSTSARKASSRARSRRSRSSGTSISRATSRATSSSRQGWAAWAAPSRSP